MIDDDKELTHFNAFGRARMVEVKDKSDTTRNAIARAKLIMQKATMETIKNNGLKKGDVLGVAQIAGIMGAKKTSDIIPMCHPLMLTGVDLSFDWLGDALIIEASVNTHGKTGVEMEALTAVSVAALTVYDMCKAIDKGIVIKDIRLLSKSGGKSGHYVSSDEHL